MATLFDLEGKEKRLAENNALMAEADFWNDQKKAQKIIRESNQLKVLIETHHSLTDSFAELSEGIGELSSSFDEDMNELISEEYTETIKKFEEFEIQVLLSGPYDNHNAILEIHPGAGGTEAMDWAAMLYRMYMRWAEDHRYTVKLIDELRDQEAGIKSVTISISGDYAYGYLKGEQGVHRLVRISPFDSAKRRHTSFASVEVMPVLPESVEIEIRPEDLKMDTFRSSGAGGQYVNMTDSAVRITHVPSGIIVSCQTERSQHMNRATAMQVLRSKLFERTLRERQEQLDSIQGEKRSIAWGSQIRSYTLQPFQLVKDHRSGCEIGNVQAVLDGSLDELIMSYLRFLKNDK